MKKTLPKYSLRRLIGALIVLCLTVNPAFAVPLSSTALPTGGNVVGGSATITTSGAKEIINQSTSHAIINWSSFDIGANASVVFNQPNAAAVTLNRVTNSQNPSQILGNLSANGTVMLVNGQGILFGQGAQVNVGGLIASVSDIDNDRFMKGDYTFDHPGNPDATISNAGKIIVEKAGLAALVGPNVTNSGLIEATIGKVQLASGDRFTVDLYGDGLINLQASDQITKQIVANSGTLRANGGQVLMTAAAAKGVVNSLINMDGIIQADSVGKKNGRVVLYAEGRNAVKDNVVANKGKAQGTSTVLVAGSVSAQGAAGGESGGAVDVLADNVGLASGASIDVSGVAGGGVIHIGGDAHGEGSTPTALNAVVQDGVMLRANAIDSGNGGSVTVWSDNYTSVAGSIEARGGATGGDGGFVETSGHVLDASGLVDASAAHGQAGTWLLDPFDITISSGGTTATTVSGVNPITFTSNGNGAIVNATSIENNLKGGTSVTIVTGGVGGPLGNITIASGTTINKTTGTAATLTLNAANNILFGNNATISASGSSGKLNVVLQANGNVTFSNGSSITSNNGDITIAGNRFVNNAGSGVLNVGTGRWLVFSANPTGDTFGNLDSGHNAVWHTNYGAPITATGNRYVFSFQPTVTFASTNDSKIYGSTASLASDYVVFGLQTGGVAHAFLGDTAAVVFSGAPSLTSTGAAASATVGSYLINVAKGTLASLDNYNLAFALTGSLTVNKAPLTITAKDQSKVYGSTFAFNGTEFTTSGTLFNGNTITGATLASAGAAGGANVSGSPYAITIGTATGSGLGNYNITYVPAAFTVTPYSLSVIADNQNKILGAANPALTYTFGALQNGDTSSVFSGALATAAVDALPGVYPITQGTLSAGSNYTIAYTPGALTIDSPQPTLNTILLRLAFRGNGKPILGTLLSIVNGGSPTIGNLANLAPAAGGNLSVSQLANLSPAAGGNVTNVNNLASLNPTAGGASVTALIQCDDLTPCGLTQ